MSLDRVCAVAVMAKAPWPGHVKTRLQGVLTAEEAGVLLLPASVFRSDLVPLPPDRFRIGFGHAGVPAGLAAMEAALR